MANGHGGARKGAGRKHGALTRRTREIAERASAEGITPLEVMLRVMRAHLESGELDKAAAVAKDAAPYCHPRLAAANITFKSPGQMTDEELEQAIALVQAAAVAEGEDVGEGMPNGPFATTH